MPKVSVLMPVYNGGVYLRAAIESILRQTFTNFEFIIVDDGSTDETPIIIDSYSDPRIVQLHNKTNKGLVQSLNQGLVAARGEYIARQDADDISLPQRLEKQVAFLDGHLRVGLVGSWYTVIDARRYEEQVIRLPTENTDIQEQLLFSNCFCHGAVMFRRDCLDSAGGYQQEFALAEDWDLWLRIAEQYELANIPEPLYRWRLVATSVTQMNRCQQRQSARHVLEEAVQRRLNGVGSARPLDKALAKYYLHLAYEDLAEGEDMGAHTNMQRAFSLDPSLAQDADFVLQSLVYRALEVCEMSSGQRARSGVEYVVRFFKNLPPSAHGLVSKQHRALGWFHIVIAFANYRARRLGDVHWHCLAGLFHDPRWLWNRGVLSLTIRTFPGARWIAMLRDMIRKRRDACSRAEQKHEG